jgi:hypothetical protein
LELNPSALLFLLVLTFQLAHIQHQTPQGIESYHPRHKSPSQGKIKAQAKGASALS